MLNRICVVAICIIISAFNFNIRAFASIDKSVIDEAKDSGLNCTGGGGTSCYAR